MFELVVPAGQEAYAGNYRGSPYPYLVSYNVFVGQPDEPLSAHNTGTPAHQVAATMDQFHAQLADALAKLQLTLASSERSAREKVIAIARFAGITFAVFTSIHPYADGNGHVCRLLVRSVFDVLGLNCRNWRIASRNPSPPDDLIRRFRIGDRTPLILAFLEMVELEAAQIH